METTRMLKMFRIRKGPTIIIMITFCPLKRFRTIGEARAGQSTGSSMVMLVLRHRK